MAASNWAQMCFDMNGEPCGTELESDGHIVKFYKNWVYIREKDEEYALMSINSGSGSFGRWNWNLIRVGSQKAIAGAVWYEKWNEEIQKSDCAGIFGIGAYAFDEEEYVGITQKTVDMVHEVMHRRGVEGFWSYCGDEKTYHEYEAYVGPFGDLPEPFRQIDLGKGFYRNQGDFSFFGVEEGTKVGDPAPEPVIIKMIDAMKNDVDISEEKEP